MRKSVADATLADKDWLTRRYVTELASLRDIAEEVGCAADSVRRALLWHDIARRPVGSAKGVTPRNAGQQAAYLQLRDRDFLLRRYVTDQMTIQQISEEVGCHWSTVRTALGAHGIPVGRVGRRNLVSRLPPAELRRMLVEADTELDAAAALGVSRATLIEVAADAGIDWDAATRERKDRRRLAAWPALLRDRDAVAEALVGSSVHAVARLAGCDRGLVRAAVTHHEIRLPERATQPDARRAVRQPEVPSGPRWADQSPAEVAPVVPSAAPEPLSAANATRTQVAAARTVEAAWDALRGGSCPARHRAVLQARVDHPQASLAELGALFGASKHAYAAMLRRALKGHGFARGQDRDHPLQPLPSRATVI